MASSRTWQQQQPTPQGAYPEKVAVKPQGYPGEPSHVPAQTERGTHEQRNSLMERVLERSNMLRALQRVGSNKGARTPGIDGMSFAELKLFLKTNWPEVRVTLLQGTYQPQPVRRVEIPKPGGGTRPLGIPTMLDRLIQQALLQILNPLFDPGFSESSFGFRPGKRAHCAVRQAQTFIQDGHTWVVDVDLENFFNRVNHDKLMARVARKVHDRNVLSVIRAFLESGVLLNGVKVATEEGAPQGGPLSPLLSNIMLDDLDKTLERRGLRFCRYADDANVYVRSRRAGERVFRAMTRYLAMTLSLKVNLLKSAVDRPWRRKFLGFSFLADKDKRIRLAPTSKSRFLVKVRELTRSRHTIGIAERIKRLNQYVQGWLGYFALADTPSPFKELDHWLRRRLRACQWRLWKLVRTRYRELRRLGIKHRPAIQDANTRKGSWRMSKSPRINQALSNSHWEKEGLKSLTQRYLEIRKAWRTA